MSMSKGGSLLDALLYIASVEVVYACLVEGSLLDIVALYCEC